MMAQVSHKLILELQRIVKEEYGKELSIAEAGEVANNLVSFYDLLLKMDTKQKENNNQETKKSSFN